MLGYLGLGLMGGPMTQRLLAAGFRVHVWNRSADKLKPAVAAGALACDTPKAVADAADIVLMCLFDTNAVEDVVFGTNGLAQGKRAKILVDHASIRPDATRAFAARLKQANGAAWIDAPVSGGVAGAAAGTLAIMCGGAEAAVERVRPVLAAYSPNVTRMGPVGSGQLTKLCNQMIVGSTIAVVAEAVRFAQNAGVDASMLPRAFAGGWADSKPMQVFVPRMVAPPTTALGALSTMLKDLDTALDFGRETNSPMPVVGAAQQVYRIMAAQGLGEGDMGAMVSLYGPPAKD
jgi:2-hydroxy-3-oxopropionate reductase